MRPTDNAQAPPDEVTDDGDTHGLPAAIGSYRVRARLGEGGMGEVFECYDPRLMRTVAVKRVRVDKGLSAKARSRFWREARALAAIDHPGVVKIFEIGETSDGGLFLAMQRVAGEALSTRLSEGPWPWATVLTLGSKLAEVLRAVHAAGVVHRDLKPSNILLALDDSPVLVDFGIATGLDPEGGALTEVGQVVGTASYMAPEQLEGRPDIGPAADVFAWGILMYRLLSARHPFARPTREQTAMALAAGAYPPLAPQTPDTPVAFVALIERCLALDPARRPASGATLVDALSALGIGARPEATPVAVTRTSALADPTELPQVTRGQASRPARSSRALMIAALAVIAIALTLALVLSGRAPPDETSETPAPAPAVSLAPRPLPPRPTIAVLAPVGGDSSYAEVLAETLRIDFDERPDDVRVIPGLALAARPAGKLLAGVDVALSGTIEHGTLTLIATDTRDQRVRWSASAPLGDDPVTTARGLAAGAWAALGIAPPEARPPITTATTTFVDALEARAAGRNGDTAKVRSLLTTALAADPKFVPARMEELALLRTERRMDELRTAAEQLLTRRDLSAHDRAMTNAWLALAKDDATAFVRDMYALLKRWPYDVVAYESLLAVLFNDMRVADLEEAARIAELALTVAPETQTIASRLVRALGFRGLGSDLETTFGRLGVPFERWVGLRSEMALYRGDFRAAIRGFAAWATEEADHVYAINMGIAARILAGDCGDAAQVAMARIQSIEGRGGDTNLSWTYSLTAQALACAERWDVADDVLARWPKRHPEDGPQARSFGVAFLIARLDDAAVEAKAKALIAEDEAAGRGLGNEWCSLLAQYASSAEALSACAALAETKSFDLDIPTHARTQWTRLARLIEARRLLLAGDSDKAIEAYRALVFPLSAVRHETDLFQRVGLYFALARAEESLGRHAEAKADWQAIVDAGYARLYQTPIYLVARRALAAP